MDVFTRAFPGTGLGNNPNPNDVREGITFGDNFQFIGNCHVPPPAQVAEDYAYDTNRSVLGTLVVVGGGNPSPNDVRDGVVFGPSSEYVGNLISPSESDVRAGIAYGAMGTEYVGTWTGSGGTPGNRGWVG